MSVPEDAFLDVNQAQRNWLPFGVVLLLLLGLAAFTWVTGVLAEPTVAAGLAVCALVLLGIPLVFTFQLQRARAQREALQKENADLRAREHSLQVLAHYDGLTGLANRRLVADRFHLAVERAKRSRKSFALVTIDLHDFKTINDQYGHAAGDAVLIAMAKRLVGALRASDTVVRLSGDQFVLIVETVESQQELAHIREKLFDALSDMITLDSGVQVNASANLGLALYPDDGVDLDHLLRVADQSMGGRKTSKATRSSNKKLNWSEVSLPP